MLCTWLCVENAAAALFRDRSNVTREMFSGCLLVCSLLGICKSPANIQMVSCFCSSGFDLHSH